MLWTGSFLAAWGFRDQHSEHTLHFRGSFILGCVFSGLTLFQGRDQTFVISFNSEGLFNTYFISIAVSKADPKLSSLTADTICP